MFRRSPILPLLGLFLLLLPGAAWAQITIETEEDRRLELHMEVFPRNGEIYFNREFLARQEARITPFAPGSYLLEFRLDGYETESFWLDLEEKYSYDIEVILRPLWAAADLSGIPGDVEVFLGAGGRPLTGPREEIPPGRHLFRFVRFGFEPALVEIEVPPGDFSLAMPEMTPVEPRIGSFRLSRRVVVPGAPGNQGRLEIRVSVTAPARGRLEIFDPRGNLVETLGRDFTRADWTVLWEPPETDLPPGKYRLRLVIEDSPGRQLAENWKGFSIETNRDDRSRFLWTGSAGMVLAPQARVLPFLDTRISAGPAAGAVPDHGAGGRDFALGLNGGFRFSPWHDFELAGTFALAGLRDRTFSRFTAGLKYFLPVPRGDFFAMAADFRWFFQRQDNFDLFYGQKGGALGVPLEFAWKTGSRGTLRFYLAPQLYGSFREGAYGEDLTAERDEGEGFFLRFYGAGGILWEGRRIAAGLSASWRTKPFYGEGEWRAFKGDFPLETAGEFSFLFPEWNLELGAFAILRFASSGGPGLTGGLSLDLLL